MGPSSKAGAQLLHQATVAAEWEAKIKALVVQVEDLKTQRDNADWRLEVTRSEVNNKWNQEICSFLASKIEESSEVELQRGIDSCEPLSPSKPKVPRVTKQRRHSI